VAYQYDPNGNTTSKTKNGVTTTFHYDIRDQLGEVRENANILGRYGYDFEGRRILKIGSDGRRQYTYDQLAVITEADQANGTVSKYDYGMDQLVRLDNRTEGRSFFHLDVLRSTVGLTDAAGGSRQSIFYDAWGDERDRIGSTANKFTFTGHELDEETGLIYAKARFYDPDIGRFLTQDSFLGDVSNVPSLHRYFYAHENPLKFLDVNGRQSTTAPFYFAYGHYRDNPVFRGAKWFADTVGSTLNATERGAGSLYGTGKFAVGAAVSTVKGAGHLILGGTFGYEPSIEAGKEFLDNAEVFLRHPIETTKQSYHRSLDVAYKAIDEGNHFKAGEVFTEEFTAPNATLVVSAGAGTTTVVRWAAGAGRVTATESVVVGESAGGGSRAITVVEAEAGGVAKPFAGPKAQQASTIAQEATGSSVTRSGRVGTAENPKVIEVDASRHPQSVKHLEETGVLGEPRQVSRGAAKANRAEALRGKEKQPGLDLDESPPAMLRQPGEPASVRPIPPCDNRGCGASIGNQARAVDEGEWVVIVKKKEP
jgi:RHS repeat-associated protein